MDKYTIDLDKVLNDFEYSELTEQTVNATYDNRKPYYDAYDNQYPKASNATTKHSINNVFHSLNEYLNSDIKQFEKPVLSEINEIETTIPTYVSTPQMQDIIRNISVTAQNADNVDAGKNGRFEVVYDPKNMDYSLSYSNTSNFDNGNRPELVHPGFTNPAFAPDIVETKLRDLSKSSDFQPENNVLLPDDTYSESDTDSDRTESILVENVEPPKPEETVTEIRNDLSKNTNPEQYMKQQMKDNNVKEKIDDFVPEEEEEEEEEEAVEDAAEKVVNFDDFEVSDTEMENELAQLEEEYKEKVVNEARNLEDEERNVETEPTVDNVDKKSADAETEDEIKFTKQETLDISEAPDTLDDAVNALTDKLSNIEIIDTDHDATADRANFALLRPNSLELNPETPENKPIDLIGNPGSTPYNNVYVENSLEENAHATGNSLSPTVSEVSTSEVSDSPTSDSCNDTSLDDNLNAKPEGANNNEAEPPECGSGDGHPDTWLGKSAPFWTPDSVALNCLHCNLKFTVIKRRHHCRACGLVLCSKCCSMKFKLEYLDNTEARVCAKCFEILSKEHASSGSDGSAESQGASPVVSQGRPLNPSNPMEYCSVVPPLQQVGNLPVTPPSVMVPVGVLKRKGSSKSRGGKSVMFCDGIRPGCDLTELDYDFNYKETQSTSRKPQPPPKHNRNLPKIDTTTGCYIPNEDNTLPPTVNVVKSEISYTECANNQNVVEMLKNEQLTFAIQRNLHVHVKIISMDCCINKSAWCFSTEGMIAVGQDEIVILLEFIDNEKIVPKDLFVHLNNIYNEAVKGTSITEMGLSIHASSNFLDSKNHAGFLYVKPSFQCVQNLIAPKEPYLVGILIHRWETPWAKIFPLRLLLRLGAEYRYYPSPIISTRHRESVYVEIGHTIINLLADFRNFSYTLPNVRGLTIHMKEKNTTVSIPINRYDQVMKALNNSSDHILAFAANFSPKADSHLVCIQDTHGNNENAYTTHAINIHNKPRKVTGASFIVLNGALKSSSGLTAKSSIVEDGLMIQILPEQMVKLRNSLRNMKDFKINCGCVNAQSDEFVNIVWTENDVNFNVGVTSPIDKISLSGVPSIRVHNGKDYVCNSGNKMIRWTEVFIIQSGDENVKTQDPVDISKLSESISKATCQALVKYLDLLATNSFLKIGIRTTLHVESVSYLAGANGVKLPPIYMKSLDNELIPILHKITQNNLGESAIVIELIFHILNM